MKKTILIIFVMLVVISQSFGQKVQILTNHLGYAPEGPKNAIVLAYEGDEISNYTIHDYYTDKKVVTGYPIKTGAVDQWKNWRFWSVDFTSLAKESKYYIQCETNKGTVNSFPFRIQDNIIERHTISDVVFYFRGQRCSGLFDQADHKMKFSTERTDIVDVSGGWYDASGDYSKVLSHLSFSTYFNPQQTPLVVYTMGKSLELLKNREDDNFNQINRRLVDEVIYGADFLVRMKQPDGSFYRTISGRGPGKKAEDRRITPSGHRFTIKKKKPTEEEYVKREVVEIEKPIFEVGYRSGAGLSIAALVLAHELNISGDFSSDTYLKSAEDAFHYLEENNVYLTNDGKENIVDDYSALIAATELYKATSKQEYKKAADKRAGSLMSRLVSWEGYKNYLRADEGDRPFFHAADAGLPVVSLIYYMKICQDDRKIDVKNIVRKYLDYELAITNEVNNPFKYARQLVQHKDGRRNSSFFYPHDTDTAPWWQGENARIASLACAARLAIPLYETNETFAKNLEKYASSQIDWILGLNPFDASMLHGTGRNNPEYMFFGSYQYTNAPGGICNGVTSGLYNENDIDFNLLYGETGKDYDWRWGEQWLPHASWYLMAVSARNVK